MKLLQELSNLSASLYEDAITVRPVKAIWDEQKDSAKIYIPSTVYQVRKIDGGEKYEVQIEEGLSRKAFATLTRTELDASFMPVRANQAPDAEGYTRYKSTDQVQAVKHQGTPIKITVDMTSVLVKAGDYIVQKTKGSDFIYQIKTARDFESQFTKK